MKNLEDGTEMQNAGLTLAALKRLSTLKNFSIGSSFILVRDKPLSISSAGGFDNTLQLSRAMAQRVDEVSSPFPLTPR